jgi:hypothetical protein
LPEGEVYTTRHLRGKKEGESISIPKLPASASHYKPWFKTVKDRVTACAVDPDLSYPWISIVGKDGTMADALREPGVGNAALDAKLRAGISTHITGEAAEKIPLVAMIISRQEEYEETHDRPMSGRQLVLIIRQYFEVRQDERITYDLSDIMDLTYPGDNAMEYFAERWDDMVRNMRRRLDEGELETVFYRKIKSSEALAKHLGRYELAESGDPDRSYAFLRKMVTVKVRDLRQNRNRDDLVHSQLKANKGPSKIPGAPGVVSGRESEGGSDSEGPVRSSALPATPISSGEEGKGKGKGKGKADRPCYHFLNGTCHKGSDCLFWHPDNPKFIAKLKLEPPFLTWVAKGTGKGGKPGEEPAGVGAAAL